MLAILHLDDVEKGINLSYFFYIFLVQFILFFKSSQLKMQVRQGIESILSPKQQRRPLPSLLSLSFFYAFYVGRLWNKTDLFQTSHCCGESAEQGQRNQILGTTISRCNTTPTADVTSTNSSL